MSFLDNPSYAQAAAVYMDRTSTPKQKQRAKEIMNEIAKNNTTDSGDAKDS